MPMAAVPIFAFVKAAFWIWAVSITAASICTEPTEPHGQPPEGQHRVHGGIIQTAQGQTTAEGTPVS